MYRLQLELRGYLILFNTLTIVLDQRKRPWQMLSQLIVLN